MTSNTRVWLQGLSAAAISSLVTAVNGVIVLPAVFNFSRDGWINTAKLVLVPTIGAVCLYLKKSPMPETTTVTFTEISVPKK